MKTFNDLYKYIEKLDTNTIDNPYHEIQDTDFRFSKSDTGSINAHFSKKSTCDNIMSIYFNSKDTVLIHTGNRTAEFPLPFCCVSNFAKLVERLGNQAASALVYIMSTIEAETYDEIDECFDDFRTNGYAKYTWLLINPQDIPIEDGVKLFGMPVGIALHDVDQDEDNIFIYDKEQAAEKIDKTIFRMVVIDPIVSFRDATVHVERVANAIVATVTDNGRKYKFMRIDRPMADKISEITMGR